MRRTVFLVLSGNAGFAVLSLVRNLLIAALLPVEDYGIAATFAMAMAAVETMSNMGLQQQIVQARRGEDAAFQASLQGFNLLRGLAAGVVLILTADLIAEFLRIPEIAWAYQVLAIIPVLTGLQHYDIYRFKRQMRFGPEIIALTLPFVVSLLSIWPALVWLGDYRVMLVAIVIQFTTQAIASHVVAERPYRIGFDREIIAVAMRFGWPILINGLLLYAVFNGEKLIVGRELSMVDLGLLAMGLTLTSSPIQVFLRALQSFFLTQLSALQDDLEQFQRMTKIVVEAALACTLLYLAASILVLRPFADLLLDDAYAALMPLLIWLGIMQGLRMARGGPALVALSRAQTSNDMWANLARLSVLPLAWWAALGGSDILVLIWLAILGEVLGLLVSFILIRARLRLSLRPLAPSCLITGIMFGMAAAFAWTSGDRLWLPPAETALVLGVTVAALWLLKDLRSYFARRDMIRMEF